MRQIKDGRGHAHARKAAEIASDLLRTREKGGGEIFPEGAAREHRLKKGEGDKPLVERCSGKALPFPHRVVFEVQLPVAVRPHAFGYVPRMVVKGLHRFQTLATLAGDDLSGKERRRSREEGEKNIPVRKFSLRGDQCGICRAHRFQRGAPHAEREGRGVKSVSFQTQLQAAVFVQRRQRIPFAQLGDGSEPALPPREEPLYVYVCAAVVAVNVAESGRRIEKVFVEQKGKGSKRRVFGEKFREHFSVLGDIRKFFVAGTAPRDRPAQTEEAGRLACKIYPHGKSLRPPCAGVFYFGLNYMYRTIYICQ